ncbi:MAG: hypothetical protein WCO00_09370 [Rhodospirillaceae bacterium]
MATAAELTGMRDALERARFNGMSSVTYDGRTVTYKSDAEMKTALNDLNRRIAELSSPGQRGFITFTTSKGV